MIQEKQLRELFKYIEANCYVCLDDVDKRDIKRIFGGVLCEDIMNDTLHEVKAEPIELKGNCSTFDMSRLVDQEYKPTDQEPEQVTDQEQPELNPIEQAYERGEKIRSKTGKQALWYQKLDENYYIDNENRKKESQIIIVDIRKQPEEWELYTEPTEQPAPFDKERFEAMFRAVVASGKNEHWEEDIDVAKWAIEQLDAYYASKEGGENE